MAEPEQTVSSDIVEELRNFLEKTYQLKINGLDNIEHIHTFKNPYPPFNNEALE